MSDEKKIKEQEKHSNEVEQNTEDTTNKEEQTISIEEQLNEQLAKEKDKYLRMFAEFENYKKRTTRERIELFSTANEEVMSALLPVVDDFDRAMVQFEKDSENEHLAGIRLIFNKLKDTLSNKGLKEVEINKGDSFDADLAEAVTQIPAGDEMKGKIVDVVEKGYKLGEKIIRFPKVVIGQ